MIVEWHKYPKEKPDTDKSREYLITSELRGEVLVEVGIWYERKWAYPRGGKVLAWAEMPEPYTEEKQ